MHETYHFEVVIKQTDQGQYLASIPVLPGCFGSGQTWEEAKDRIVAAARCYCLNMLENGASVPQIVSTAPSIIKDISINL